MPLRPPDPASDRENSPGQNSWAKIRWAKAARAAPCAGSACVCVLIDAGLEAPLPNRPPVAQAEHSAAARRPIFRSNERVTHVPVICDGWACVAEHLTNGRRQILSFVLPGDLVSTSLLFEPFVRHEIEAITAVRYRGFDRVGLRETMAACPDVLDKLSKECIEEKEGIAALVIDLGQRMADERVARLILDLMERLARRSAVRAQTFAFPLRQTQIADALGLSPVYVNRVLNDFRQNGLVKIENRSLTILDAAELRRLAGN